MERKTLQFSGTVSAETAVLLKNFLFSKKFQAAFLCVPKKNSLVQITGKISGDINKMYALQKSIHAFDRDLTIKIQEYV